MTHRRSLRAGPPQPGPRPCLIYRWDLDKTYLKSEFDSLRELVRIPFEKPEDKVAAPGVAALIRALRTAAAPEGREVRVYFISASPPQIGRSIKKKLELDGIEYDGIVFKDQLQRLMRGKFRHLREQVGFKLTELLKSRRGAPPAAREYLFGDDWESDPIIYSLYADLVAGRVDSDELADILAAIRVDPPLVEQARAVAAEIPHREAVARIFITLERRTPPANFRSFGARLVPTFNYFQTAACLFDEGVLDLAGVAQVATSLVTSSAYTRERLANSLADIQRRGHLGRASVAAMRDHLRAHQLLPAERRAPGGRWRPWWRALQARLRAARPAGLATTPAPIDYRALVARQNEADSDRA